MCLSFTAFKQTQPVASPVENGGHFNSAFDQKIADNIVVSRMSGWKDDKRSFRIQRRSVCSMFDLVKTLFQRLAYVAQLFAAIVKTNQHDAAEKSRDGSSLGIIGQGGVRSGCSIKTRQQ